MIVSGASTNIISKDQLELDTGITKWESSHDMGYIAKSMRWPEHDTNVLIAERRNKLSILSYLNRDFLDKAVRCDSRLVRLTLDKRGKRFADRRNLNCKSLETKTSDDILVDAELQLQLVDQEIDNLFAGFTDVDGIIS